MITVKCPQCKHETTIYSTQDAADYLGLGVPALKYHIYTSKNIRGQLVGHTLMFVREELDRFLSVRRGPGRLRKNTP